MKVQADGREYWIEFAYDVVAPGRKVTTCLLRDGSAPRAQREDAPIVAQGRVKRYFKDPPNREKARKFALAKALKDLDARVPAVFNGSVLSGQSPLSGHSPITQKVRRRLFWIAYLYRKSPVASSQSSVPKSSGN